MSNAGVKIGWIGTGVMGSAMCGHLVAAGYSVSVANRSPSRAEGLVAAGARWCATPAEAAGEADVIFAMVGYPSDVRSVILGPHGALAIARPGSLIVDMTTSEPLLAKEIFAIAAEKGVEALDAPVSGGDVGARNASLVIMVGGGASAFSRALPFLQKLGSTVVHQGGPGAGQHTKMMNQIAIAGGMIGICEALLYAYRAGLDVERAIDTVARGAAGSWSLTNYAPRILRGDFEPGFKVAHFIKDLGIALREAKEMNLALPGLALAHQLYVAVSAQGYEGRGTHALLLGLAQLSAVEWTAGSMPSS